MSASRLKELVKAFEKEASRYREFGARDTEPDGKFQWYLVRAFRGKKPQVSDDPRVWELYDRGGAQRAALALAVAARECVACIEDTPLRSAGEVEEFLRGYCWRVDW